MRQSKAHQMCFWNKIYQLGKGWQYGEAKKQNWLCVPNPGFNLIDNLEHPPLAIPTLPILADWLKNYYFQIYSLATLIS